MSFPLTSYLFSAVAGTVNAKLVQVQTARRAYGARATTQPVLTTIGVNANKTIKDLNGGALPSSLSDSAILTIDAPVYLSVGGLNTYIVPDGLGGGGGTTDLRTTVDNDVLPAGTYFLGALAGELPYVSESSAIGGGGSGGGGTTADTPIENVSFLSQSGVLGGITIVYMDSNGKEIDNSRQTIANISNITPKGLGTGGLAGAVLPVNAAWAEVTILTSDLYLGRSAKSRADGTCVALGTPSDPARVGEIWLIGRHPL